MLFKTTNLKVNFSSYASDGSGKPVFSWGAEGAGKYQSEYRIVVRDTDTIYWDSGFVKSSSQTAVYNGSALPCGRELKWEVEIRDENGVLSEKGVSRFIAASVDKWEAEWICSPLETAHEAQYFKKSFTLSEIPKAAVLYHCGLGLDKAYINGIQTNDYCLAPDFTNYKKECCYVTDIIDVNMFSIGKNSLNITVGGGWRKNYGKYLDNMSQAREIEFMGGMCLIAQLVLRFSDGRRQVIATDGTWEVSRGEITYSHLFGGETYDETAKKRTVSAVYSDFAPEKLVPKTTEPVRVKRRITPINSYMIGDKTIYDFGENLSGVIRLRAVGHASKGCRFTLRHAETLTPDGELHTGPLRSAEATDRYICRGGNCNIDCKPEFTYHGFRYAELTVDGEFDGDISLTALKFYTDIDADGFFKCSDPVVNEIYHAAIRTERCNIHSIATDCPQRDERMAWMNDATVRFMFMPYNFSAARLFGKIADDIANEQDELGRITCTAPFVFGERPADPVCSAYLIAAMEHYRMTGSTSVIASHYDGFVKWSDYLKSRERDGIVDYSYYGDWAGPEDACVSVDTIGDTDKEVLEGFEPGAAHSKYIPGKLISTGCHYMNYRLLTEFAKLLGKQRDRIKFEAEAQRVRTAYLKKWVKDGTVFNGSQGCQAFSLFIGILPEAQRQRAADIMAKSVISSGVRITTGNIVTPMLLDMLSEYGYCDVAWELLSRTDYPSLGYMLTRGATTLWERYELKDDVGMNSHDHPMHGASVGWLYRSLAGFKVSEPLKKYSLRPCIPEKIRFFEMRIPLLCGGIYIKYEKRDETRHLLIDVPFNTELTLLFCGNSYKLNAGFHHIEGKV